MNERLLLDSRAQRIFLNASGIVKKEKVQERPISDSEVVTAKAFIGSCCKKLKQKNQRMSSYGLKHSAENWGRRMNKLIGKTIFTEYVSNGAFIKAADEMGFMIYPIEGSYNCHFPISMFEGNLLNR